MNRFKREREAYAREVHYFSSIWDKSFATKMSFNYLLLLNLPYTGLRIRQFPRENFSQVG
jgi:hypothetical protein